MRRILVGTDFSRASDRAVHTAVGLARRTNAALRLVHVMPPRRQLSGFWRVNVATVAAAQQRAGAALKRAVETHDPSRQLDVATGVVSGKASAEVARAAREYGADLIVIGALGEHEVRMSQVALGGTAIKLLQEMPVPLLLVRMTPRSPGPVLAAVDLSPVSGDILTWARAMATGGEDITVFHGYDVPFAARLDAYGVARESIDLYSDAEHSRRELALRSLIATSTDTGAAQGVIERGDVIERLFEHIRELKPNLVVVGKHGRRRGGRAGRSGSVSRHVAMFAPTNVLVVTARTP